MQICSPIRSMANTSWSKANLVAHPYDPMRNVQKTHALTWVVSLGRRLLRLRRQKNSHTKYIRIHAHDRKSFPFRQNFRESRKHLATRAVWPKNFNTEEHSDNDTHQITYWLERKSTKPTKRKTGRCGNHIVAPQNKSQHGGTHRHAPTRKSPIHMGNTAARVRSSTMYANRAKMLAIMAAGPATPMRSQIQQWHKSLNVLTRADTNIPIKNRWTRHRDLFFLHAKYCGDHINLVAHIVRLKSWNLLCKRQRWSFAPEQTCWSLGHVRNHGGMGHKSNTGESTDNNTHRITYNQNGNLQTLETLVARLGMHPGRCGDHIVAPQDKSQHGGTHGHAPTRESPKHIHTQQRLSFFCLQEFSRVAKHVGNHGKWTFHSNVVPTSTGTEIESRFHHSLPRQRANMPISNRWLVKPTTSTTKHCGDLFVVTIVLCHIGGTPPRGPALESPLFMTRTASVAWLPAFLRIAWTRSKYGGLPEELRCKRPLWQPHTHIEWRTDKNGNLQTCKTQIGVMEKNFPIGRCADSTRRLTTVANLVAHIRTLQSGNLQHTCATTLVDSLPPEFTRVAQIAGNRGAWPTPPMREESTVTQIDVRTHQNGKVQTYESKIGEPRHQNVCTPNIVATTSRPHQANLVAYILTVQRWNPHNNAHRWSCPFHQNSRGSSAQTSLLSWPLGSPFQRGAHCNKHTHTHIDSRTHNALPLELTDIPISSRQTRRANDLHNQALRLSHSDDHGPKPTWWHTSLRSNAGISTIHAKKQRWSFHVQPTRGSLGQVRDRSSARQTESEACLQHLEIGARCKSCGFTQPEAQQHFNEWCLKSRKTPFVCWKINCRKCPRSSVKPARITSASTSPWSACTVPFGPDDGVVELQARASRVGLQEYGGEQAPDKRLIGANCNPNFWTHHSVINPCSDLQRVF